MQVEIRSVIKMAQDGMTKQEIMDELGLNEVAYRQQMKQFSKSNKETLRRLLVSNAKRTTVPDTPKVVNILDTSYICSRFCRFEEISDAVILPKVYEQLVTFYRNGSAKVCKFLHMLLDKRCEAELIKEVETTEECPAYEDEADMEIISYAKQQIVGKVTPIVYTADKVLALRCDQQGIRYQFFETNQQD